MAVAERLAPPTSVDADRMIVRRKCACGANAGPIAQSCPDCERKKLQPKLVVGSQQAAEEREADRVADAVMRESDGRTGANVGAISSAVQRSSAGLSTSIEPQAPPIVDQVLGRSGQALDSDARHFFERRFERDFSNVRVHADAEAAASARAVDAHAYTVGNHLVFGASRYAPDTASGRRLLAHELTHVVQQGATLRRLSMNSSLVQDAGDRDDEEERPIRRLQRQAVNVGVKEPGPDSDSAGQAEAEPHQVGDREKALAECKQATPDPPVCSPSTPPGWSSFTGPVPAGTTWGAQTECPIEPVDVPSQKCEEKILGQASGPSKRFQGVFHPDLSWVQPCYPNASKPKKNGCAVWIARCEEYFAKGGATPIALPAEKCAAFQPRYDGAKNAAECSSILGKDCNETMVRVSKLLLKHEQKHLGIACALAKKGNDALTEGKSFEQVAEVLKEKWDTLQAQYDDQTSHGCKAAAQATWNAKITKGLPAIKLFP